MKDKTLRNTDLNAAKDNVSDLVVFGGDLFKLLSKASSESEGWMKSTKAMEIAGVGCIVQVTTQQLNDSGVWPMTGPDDMVGDVYPVFSSKDTLKHSVIAEALTFVPGVRISELRDEEGKVIARILVSMAADASKEPNSFSEGRVS